MAKDGSGSGAPPTLSAALGIGKVAPHPAVVAGLLLDRAPVGLALLDSNDRILWSNEALTSLACPTRGDLGGRRVNELLRPFGHILGERVGYNTLTLGPEWQQAWLLVDDRVGSRLGLVSLVPFEPDRDAGKTLLTFVDLNADSEAVVDGRQSDVGGIASAWIFEDRLSHAFERAERLGQGLAVMMIQLHGLAPVVAASGAEIASRVSRRAGRRLANTLRREDSLIQLDRDRWGVLLEHPMSPENLHVIAERCQEALEPPFTLAGHAPVLIEPRIGIALCPEDGDEPEVLLMHAEHALEEAAPGTHAFFDGSLQRWITEKQTFRHSLQEALLFPAQHFSLVFQPQFDLVSGRCCGLEALVRWRHPERGELGPDVFLALAAEMQLADRLDRWVIQQVIAQRRLWATSGSSLAEVDIAVNVHVQLLDQEAFDRRALDLFLRQQGDESLNWLSLEIQSSGLSAIGERHSHLLRRIVGLGVRLTVDGLGRSPVDLFGMAVLPVSLGKIGRELVHALSEARPSSRQSLAALTQSLLALELDSVVVGVETVEQLSTVREVGLLRAQGNLLSQPLALDALEAWAAAGSHPFSPL
ncbi:EAL domain-containing protein [Halomonas sp. V046]|uniref:EAL domain-containing protein n=1 Tax=Halomonas sp. V046 TaxID=3459611 RepID=UPI0040444784